MCVIFKYSKESGLVCGKIVRKLSVEDGHQPGAAKCVPDVSCLHGNPDGNGAAVLQAGGCVYREYYTGMHRDSGKKGKRGAPFENVNKVGQWGVEWKLCLFLFHLNRLFFLNKTQYLFS